MTETEKKCTSLFEVEANTEFQLEGYGYHIFKRSADKTLNSEFEEAKREGTIKKKFNVVDLHCHTNLTDGVLSPQELVDNAVANGVSVIAVTDHNCTKSALEAQKYAQKHYPEQIEVKLGVELATNEGHLLVYFENEAVMHAVEKAFPFLKYVNDHTDDMREDYTEYYKNFMKNAPSAFSLEETLNKLEEIKKEYGNNAIKTSIPHPMAGNKSISSMAKKRGLTSLGGVMSHENAEKKQFERVDMLEVFNDFAPNGNEEALAFALENNLKNLATGSDTRIADPQTLTLVKKGQNIFDAIQNGNTIFIQREKNGVDRYYDRIVAFEAWLLDYYFSEVKHDVKDVLDDNFSKIARHRLFSEPIQRLQVKLRKRLYKEAHEKWLKRHKMKQEAGSSL